MRTCKCGYRHCNKVTECDECLEKRAVQVGTVTVAEPFEYHDSFESAAAYHSIRVEPGVYPVMVKVSRFDGKRYLAVPFSGTVTSSGYGARRYTDKIGTTDTIVACPYKYILRDGQFHGAVAITDEAALDTVYGV